MVPWKVRVVSAALWSQVRKDTGITGPGEGERHALDSGAGSERAQGWQRREGVQPVQTSESRQGGAGLPGWGLLWGGMSAQQPGNGERHKVWAGMIIHLCHACMEFLAYRPNAHPVMGHCPQDLWTQVALSSFLPQALLVTLAWVHTETGSCGLPWQYRASYGLYLHPH